MAEQFKPKIGETKPTTRKTKKKLIKILIVVATLIVLTFLLYTPISKAYHKFIASHQPPQTAWYPFDSSKQDPKFTEFSFVHAISDGDKLPYSSFFHLNRMSVSGQGQISTFAECKDVEYKCGNSGWKKTLQGVPISNGCIVKIKPRTYCNLALPGGTLVGLGNSSGPGLIRGFFSDGSLQVQIVSTNDKVKIIRNVTYQQSDVWIAAPKNSAKPLVVEVGDYVIESTGTVFDTATNNKSGIVETVTSGSVRMSLSQSIYKNKVAPILIPQGQYAMTNSFATEQCPALLKACGKSCVPRNAACCNGATGDSYCVNPSACQNNDQGKCNAHLWFPPASKYCCNNSDFEENFNLFNKGSDDCGVGFKFCGMSCIPDSKPCCFPDKDSCPSDKPVQITAIPTPAGSSSNSYLYMLYYNLLFDPNYLAIVNNPAFPIDSKLLYAANEYAYLKLREAVTADYLGSNKDVEEANFCANNNSYYACRTTKSKTNTGSSSSGTNRCAQIPAVVKAKLPLLTSCDASHRGLGGDKSDWVYCIYSDGNAGYLPPECVPSGVPR